MDASEEFVREAKSQIRALNDGLLAVENDDDDVVIDELFRVAHSLKGSCRVQGLSEAGELAHALEDVLDAIRGSEVAPTTTLIDEALDAVDLLEATVRVAANGGETDRDVDATRTALRSTLEEQRAQTVSDDRRDRASADGDSGDEWSPSDDDLNDDVVEALEETTEFDDIDALLDEQDDASTGDELDSWGLLDEDESADESGAPEGKEPAETPDNPGAFFEETKADLDDDGGVDSLQADIDSVEFGEFDDDDNYTIDELVDLEPDETGSDAGSAPVEEVADEVSGASTVDSEQLSRDDESNAQSANKQSNAQSANEQPNAQSANERGDPLIESESASSTEPVSSDSVETADRESAELPSEGTTSTPRGTDHPVDVDEDSTDEESVDSTFVFGNEVADDAVPQDDDGGEPETVAVSETDPTPDDKLAESGSDYDGTVGRPEPAEASDDASVSDPVESPSLPEAQVPDSDSVPDANLDVDLSEGLDPDLSEGLDPDRSEGLDSDLGDDWERQSRMDVSVDEGMAEFESRFDDLLGQGDAQETEQDERPTFQAAVPTIGESRLDADEFPTADDSDRPEAADEFDRLQTMTVDVDTADRLLNVAEELSLTHLRLDEAVGPETDDAIREEVANLLRVVTEYRRSVMDVRLMPLKTAVETIPRTVRDVARSQDKEVELVVDDVDVELDRGIIDRLKDPLVHVARNAVDHGIEPPDDRIAAGKPPEGTIEIRAERNGDEVVIEVSDDGRGIEPEAVRQRAVDKEILTQEEARRLTDDETDDLLFEPGFTTREEVTDVSGRGVGMDVVGRTVADLNGTVTVDSEPGEGTTIRLTVPVSIVFTEVLFVEANGRTFGIPMSVVEQITTVPAVRTVDGREVVQRSDLDLVGGLPDGVEAEDSYPFIRLESALNLSQSDAEPGSDDGQIIWVRAETERLAIRCDRVVTSREVVVRPYGDVLRDVPGVSGATTLGDGEAVNVLDVGSI